MAIGRLSPRKIPFWGMRMVEWLLLSGVVLVLVWVFFRQVQVMKGQAELAAVRSTLGALRTALVIDYLKQEIAGKNSAAVRLQSNPFELLQHHSVNYRGDMTPAQAVLAPAGSWVFDPVCVCVGYAPIDDQWFESPSGKRMAWYHLNSVSGPVQLTAKEAYVWQSQTID